MLSTNEAPPQTDEVDQSWMMAGSAHWMKQRIARRKLDSIALSLAFQEFSGSDRPAAHQAKEA